MMKYTKKHGVKHINCIIKHTEKNFYRNRGNGGSGKRISRKFPDEPCRPGFKQKISREGRMEAISTLTWCRRHNVLVVGAKASPHYDDVKGRIVKGAPIGMQSYAGRKGWTEGLVPQNPAYSLYLAFLPEYVVVDCDIHTQTAEETFGRLFTVLHTTANYIVESGSGGYHFYYKKPENKEHWIKNTNLKRLGEYDAKKQVDIQTDKGGVYLAGSSYEYNGKQYNYTAVKGTLDEIGEMPKWLVDALDEHYGEKHVEPQRDPTEVESRPETAQTTQIPDERTQIIEIVELLPMECIDNYTDWIMIGMVFFNEGLTLQDWEAVSRRSRKYEAGCCVSHWNSFKEEKNRKVSVASLWKKLKDMNPAEFAERMETRRDFWKLIKELNHNDCARFFYNMKQTAYLWNERMGWLTLSKENIWSRSERQVPSNLKRNFADTMQEITKEQRNAELRRYAAECQKNTVEDQPKITKEHQQKMKLIKEAYLKFGNSDFDNGVINFLPSYYVKEYLESLVDMNIKIFAFTNGCLDLEMGKFRKIRPDDYVSTTAGYDLNLSSNKKAREETKKFMASLFENFETERYLLCVLAFCLLGVNKFEEFYCFTGSGGNGKGALVDLIQSVFGEYYMSVENNLFTRSADKIDQGIPELVNARYKRILMTSEPESEDRLQGGLLKKISGNDMIGARRLNSNDVIKYIAQFKLFLQMNNIPNMTKVDGGIVRRVRIIHFPFKFVAEPKPGTEERQGDPDLKDTYCKSLEWRNEFMLMLWETYMECKDVKQLKMPESVKDATGDYLNDNNWLKEWLNTHYEITNKEDDKIASEELRVSYMQDCNVGACDARKFKQCLIDQNKIKWKKAKNGNFYIGLKHIQQQE